MRTITLEEHFISPGFLAGPGREFSERLRNSGARGARIYEQLQDIGDKRIAEMDAAGIDMQVLSLNAPGVEQAEVAEQISIASESNDFLAEAVKKHPKRFAGLCSLPMAAPDKAAEELERRVRQQGFKGTLINGHTRGRYLDDKFFWPILERAEALNVPIYLHPTVSPKAVVEALFGGFSPTVTARARGRRLGLAYRNRRSRHSHDPRRGVRPLSKAANRHRPPGRGIPFMLPRLDKNFPTEMTKLERPLGATSAKTFITHLAASTSRRRSSTCCLRSASGGSCSRSIIPMVRWRRRAHSCSNSRSARRIGSVSRTAMRSSLRVVARERRRHGWPCSAGSA